MSPGSRSKILNSLLIITSLFGYLEWGTQNRVFLFEAEGQIILKLFNHPEAVLHPFTVLPLAGQVILLITLFQNQPGKGLTYAGLAGIAVLMVMILVIGLISLNAKIFLSALPFMGVSFLTFRHNRKIGTS